jgi:hypothetical protein
MKSKYLLIGGIFTLVFTLLLHFTYSELTKEPFPGTWTYFVFPCFYLINFFGLLYITGKMKGKNQQFVNAFMAASSIRMLLSALVIIIVVLVTGKAGKMLAIFYVAHYMSLLLTETLLLSKAARKV